MQLVKTLALLTLATLSLAVSAQVLSGSINVQGKDVQQQRLTLQCPFFDEETGWAKENSVYTIHILDTRNVSGEVAADIHGTYSHIAKKWARFNSIDQNRIVFSIFEVAEKKVYVVDGRNRRGDIVSKGEVVEPFLGPKLCANAIRYIDRNTLELKFELDNTIPAPSVSGGILTKCEGVDAVPRGETVVKSQCQIVPYRPTPNRIGF